MLSDAGGKRSGSIFIAVAAMAAMSLSAASAQTWTRLAHDAPQRINLMLLLSDGTVMAANNYDLTTTVPGNAWYRLTPDARGSYVNGTWSTLASMIDTRLYYQTQVLKDGRVYVSGGEYGTGGRKAELYDPATNSWTAITPPGSLWSLSSDNFYDCNSEILPDGTVLTMPVFPHSAGVGMRYNPATNAWSFAGRLFRGTYQDEASWSKLPDNSIITIDPFGTNSERYIPSTNTWVNDSVVPVSLYDPFGFEIGASVLLPNGKVLFLGSTGHIALYTPSGSTAPGTWAAGPDIPGGHGTPDAPAAMMPNGKVLCSVSPIPTSANHFPSPTTFYEYDYSANSFAAAPAPVGNSDPIPCFGGAMLVLPDGNILYSHMDTSVYVYRPSGTQLGAGAPTIATVITNPDGSYHLTGTLLNGISEGASYGDDYQMNTNYPIVRITRGDGNVYYARTFNWSSTGVMTGSQVVSTEFRTPASLPAAFDYSIVAVANGIASAPFCLTAPGITTAPQPQQTCIAGTASMSVTEIGFGTPGYQWTRNGTPIPAAGNPSAATPTFVIAAATPADAGIYACVVSNSCGSTTSAAARLDVCVGDFNCDGGTDGQDIGAFISMWERAEPTADVNTDGGIDGQDVETFFGRWEAGC
jgi:hypothetical protein